MHPSRRLLVVLFAVALVAAACGDDDGDGGATTTAETTTTAVDTTTTAAPTTSSAPTTTVASTTTAPTTTAGPPTSVVELEQPAVWPAPDVVFATPEEAAADFVTEVLGVPPELGEFAQGDSRSGEIEVFSPGEGDEGTPVSRGLLLLRQLGPDNGWFVIGAANDNASITAPETLAEVEAGPLTVDGEARGFEATVVVTAFVAGDADAVLDEVITQGGAFADPEPYSVELDLSATEAGQTIALLVRGGTGLETDPGDFGAIPVVVVS